MKTFLLFCLILATPCVSSADEAAIHRGRAETLRSQGRLEQALDEYKRALAERHLLPACGPRLRGENPLSGAIERHREAVASRLASPESR